MTARGTPVNQSELLGLGEAGEEDEVWVLGILPNARDGKVLRSVGEGVGGNLEEGEGLGLCVHIKAQDAPV